MKIYQFKQKAISSLRPSARNEILETFGAKNRKSDIEIEVKSRFYNVNKNRIESSTRLSAIGFFSGAGGLDLGAHMAGVNVLSSMDHEPDCVKTLKANKVFQSSEQLCADIQDISGATYKKLLKDSKPEKLILVGGPPCQPFSKAGYWVTHEKRLGSADPRNMIGQYLRLIKELKPDGFLLENVESLLHPKNRDAVSAIQESIDRLGYKFILFSADARDFGVPQRRKRVFFIASRNPIKTPPVATHGLGSGGQTSRRRPHERVIDWIWKYDCETFFEPEEVTKGKTYGHELTEVPPGKNYFALTERDGYPNPKFEANKRFWNFLLKLHPLEPSWTLAAQPGPWVGPLHWNNRRLRIPELAAIQTFPSDFVFCGSRRSIQKQIGNAVPPLLAKAMVRCLVENL